MSGYTVRRSDAGYGLTPTLYEVLNPSGVVIAPVLSWRVARKIADALNGAKAVAAALRMPPMSFEYSNGSGLQVEGVAFSHEAWDAVCAAAGVERATFTPTPWSDDEEDMW